MSKAMKDTLILGRQQPMPPLSSLSRWLGAEEPTGNGKLPAAVIPTRKEKR